MALRLESPSCPKIFHGDSRAHPAGPVIFPVLGEEGRRKVREATGRDATATPDVNHFPPLVGQRASKVDGKAQDVSLPEK